MTIFQWVAAQPIFFIQNSGILSKKNRSKDEVLIFGDQILIASSFSGGFLIVPYCY